MGRRFASVCRENWQERTLTGMAFRMCGVATGNKEKCEKGHLVQMVDYVVLCSVVPFLGPDGKGISIQRSYGSYFIPAVQHGGYHRLVIEDAQDYKVVHQDLSSPPDVTPVHRPCREIAEDILRAEFRLEVGNGIYNSGAFLCAEDEPTEAELAEAHRVRDLYLVAAIQLGDEQHAQAKLGRPFYIPEWAKRAAMERKEQREWIYAPAAAKTQCEGCGTYVDLLADGRKPAVCVKCGAPINKELATSLGLWAPPTAAAPAAETEAVEEEVPVARSKAKK